MAKLRKKGFTLLELIAVLVIMAMLALIVTPLVMNIIRKARISADKRSIDAYGRSIELAIAGYLLDNGKFPTDVSQLTIEYSGNEVVCSTTQLNSDSSVYLTGCTVAGRTVDYSYGKYEAPSYTAYSIGDKVSYNGVTYYVIEDSDTTNDTVKLLKENPLTKTEMDNLNLSGITITESDGYGAVQYGETADYSASIIKQVVDAWAATAIKLGDSATARLITIDEIEFETREIDCCGGCGRCIETRNVAVYDWMYNTNHPYWTISQNVYQGMIRIWFMRTDGYLQSSSLDGDMFVVRPVLELNKSAEITKIN